MKNSTLKVLAGLVSASMALMAMISVVSAEDPIFGDNGIMTLGATGNNPTIGDSNSEDNDDDDNNDDDDGNGGDNGNGGSTGDNGNGGSTGDNGNGGSTGDNGNGGSTSGNGNGSSTGDNGNGGSTSGNGNGGNTGDNGNGGSTGDNNPSSPEATISGSSVNNRVGEGGAVAGAADAQPVSSAQAVSAIASVKSGGNVAITMGKDTVIPAKTIAAFAEKYNASLTLNYSGVGITVNSEDIDPDVVKSFNFKTSARFLTRAEVKAFKNAKEVRQLSLTGDSLNGIDKVTVTFKMRGGSKGMTAKLLLRTANGKYILVDEAKVGDDRNVDFEITEAGNYIVYTGEADIEYEEAE